MMFSVFFFQAEDGIRDWSVTGVQTCALPISIKAGARSNGLAMHPDGKRLYLTNGGDASVMVIDTAADKVVATIPVGQRRSEERRVGKEYRSRWSASRGTENDTREGERLTVHT